MFLSIPNGVLLGVSIFATWLGGVLRNQYCKKYEPCDADIHFFLFLSQLTAWIILLASASDLTISFFTLLTAFALGLFIYCLAWAGSKALRIGPMGIYNVLVSASMVLPALSGAVWWSESLPLPTVCGMVGMLIMIPLIIKPQNGKQGSVNGKYLLLCFLSVFCNGMVGITQKFHQSSDHKGEISAFLLIAFTFSTASSLVLYLRSKQSNIGNWKKILSPMRAPFWLGVIGGICTAVPNVLNLYLSGAMDSAVFFPLVNGGGLLLAVLAAVFLFKERLMLRQTVGIIIGFLSVLLLSGVI